MKQLKCLFIAATIFGAAALGTAQAETRVGIAGEPYPPFTWKEADGSWKGFEIDLLGAICSEAQLDCKIVETAWDGIIPALTSKKIDMIMNSMTITEKRKEVIAFSNPYYSSAAAFIGSEGHAVGGSAESLSGKIIGVQASTTHATYARESYGTVAEIKLYSTQDEATADLAAGRVDVVIADAIAMDAWLKSDAGRGYSVVGTVPVPADQIPSAGAGMRKEDTALKAKFDAALATLLDNGAYEQIAGRYFKFDIYGLPRN